MAASEAASAAGDRALELRARLELEYVRLLQEPGVTAEALLATAAEAAPLFEAVADHRSLGRTRLIAGFVEGGHLGSPPDVAGVRRAGPRQLPEHSVADVDVPR